jgi:hypothetical protein
MLLDRGRGELALQLLDEGRDVEWLGGFPPIDTTLRRWLSWLRQAGVFLLSVGLAHCIYFKFTRSVQTPSHLKFSVLRAERVAIIDCPPSLQFQLPRNDLLESIFIRKSVADIQRPGELSLPRSKAGDVYMGWFRGQLNAASITQVPDDAKVAGGRFASIYEQWSDISFAAHWGSIARYIDFFDIGTLSRAHCKPSALVGALRFIRQCFTSVGLRLCSRRRSSFGLRRLHSSSGLRSHRGQSILGNNPLVIHDISLPVENVAIEAENQKRQPFQNAGGLLFSGCSFVASFPLVADYGLGQIKAALDGESKRLRQLLMGFFWLVVAWVLLHAAISLTFFGVLDLTLGGLLL